MKPLTKILALGTMAALLAFTPVKSKADVSASVAFKNKYLAGSGFLFAEEPVMQPSLTYFNNGFYGVLASNVSSEEGLNEVDYTVGYTKPLNGFSLEISAGLFDLRNFGENDLNDNTSDVLVKLKKEFPHGTSFEGGLLKTLLGEHFQTLKEEIGIWS